MRKRALASGCDQGSSLDDFMVQIALIRPGSTDYDQQQRIQGNLDVPLNEEGLAEVGRIIDELRGSHVTFDTIYCACGEPAVETAQAIAEALDVRLRRLHHMQNLNHGLWQGMRIDEVRVKQPKVYRQWQEQPECVCPPDGEMISHAAERVQTAIAKLVRRHKTGAIAVVAPEPLASLIRRYLTRGDLETFGRRPPNMAVGR